MRIEHVNISVSNPDESARLLSDIFGWKVRWAGPSLHGGRTVHVGADDHYIALYTGPDGEHEDVRYPKGEPLQHIGIEVADLDDAERRAAAAGYEPYGHDDYDPGRRFYFRDRDGIEFEVVSYA